MVIFHAFSSARRVFYCHFPDQLLTDRLTTLKLIYRKVIDYIEASTISHAHVVCVNSKFTSLVLFFSVAHQQFSRYMSFSHTRCGYCMCAFLEHQNKVPIPASIDGWLEGNLPAGRSILFSERKNRKRGLLFAGFDFFKIKIGQKVMLRTLIN